MTNQLSQETLKIDMDEPAKLFLTLHQQKLYINDVINQDRKILRARENKPKKIWNFPWWSVDKKGGLRYG